MSARILLAEDEPAVRHYIQKALTKLGMSIQTVGSVQDAETALLTNEFDLLILDRILSDDDAIHRLSHFRTKYPNQRVLIVSGKNKPEDKIGGLDRGADDYLAKPFHIDELIARIRSLLRRNDHRFIRDHILRVGDLELNLESKNCKRKDSSIELSAQEFKLLYLFASHPKKIFSKEEILERLWDESFDPHSNVVEAAIKRLRSKINLKGMAPLIQSKRGVGYCFGEF